MNLKNVDEDQSGRQPNGASEGNDKHFALGEHFYDRLHEHYKMPDR
jgi:hypothetical protein